MASGNQKITLKDQVYQQIIELICSGELTTERIFTEGEMIERFGVSKSPVREALIQLCHEEVLKSIPRCGYQVVEISARNIHDLTELRMYLELSGLHKLDERLDEDMLRELRALARVKSDKKDMWSAWNNNVRFHQALTECAGNRLVSRELERAMATCTRAYAQLYAIQKSVISPDSENFHEKILNALERHEIFGAHEWLKKDILFMEQLLLDAELAR